MSEVEDLCGTRGAGVCVGLAKCIEHAARFSRQCIRRGKQGIGVEVALQGHPAGDPPARIGGESLRLLLGVGLLGGFTTFSAFSLETMLMIDRGHAMTALGYALASVAGAFGALGLGLTLMRNVAA